MVSDLIDAVRGGRIDDVRALLDADPALVSARAPDGASTLLLAVYQRRLDIAAVFVERRRDELRERARQIWAQLETWS